MIPESCASERRKTSRRVAMLGACLPPRPSSPWQAAQLDAKIFRPECCDVCEAVFGLRGSCARDFKLRAEKIVVSRASSRARAARRKPEAFADKSKKPPSSSKIQIQRGLPRTRSNSLQLELHF